MIENPVFIVGTERSGSNLLRLMLNELPGVCVPHPPHLLRDLQPRLSRYGNLQDDAAFLRLIHDAVRLVELHFAPWPIKLSSEKIFRECTRRDLYAIYATIYEQYREFSGKARWACKSTFMIHHVPEILEYHLRPQFIHLVRDPRDVAVSAMKSVFSHYHPYFVAHLWKREQRLGIDYSKSLSAKTWLSVRYEDLIRDPRAEMQKVCAFLGEPYHEDLLHFFEQPAAKELSNLSRSWANVGRPVLPGNSEKFRAALPGPLISLIETLTREEMLHFNYALGGDGLSRSPNRIHKAAYFLSEEWMMLREECVALLKDRNAKHRLRKKLFLWTLRFR